ncbi:MAG: DMT family transporter [Halorientalis sp.]
MTGSRRTIVGAPLLAAALWGGMYVVSKWGFSAIPPITLGFLRVTVGGTVLYAVVATQYPDREFARADLKGFLGLGALLTATIVTQFVGTDLTNASQASLLTVATPVFTVLLGATLLKEHVTTRRALGVGLAAVGTLVVIAGQYDLSSLGSANLLGVAGLLAASLAWAGYTVWGKPLVRKTSALETATYATLASIPMLGVLAACELAVEGTNPMGLSLSLPVLGAIAYLGIGSTAVAWYLWYKGLEYVDAGTVAVFFFAQPLVGGVLGALLLSEDIGPLFVAGGLVMIVGVYLTSTDE